MSERDVRLYLNDVLEGGGAILEYTKNLTYEQFVQDRKTYSATIREFEIIGEAVGKLSDELKLRYPEIEWQDIKDFRNLLIHEYFGVDLEIVWKIIHEDLVTLLKTIEKILFDLNHMKG